MERVKFSDTSNHSYFYELVLNGVSGGDNSLSISFVKPSNSSIESIMDSVINAERIEILSSTDEIISVYNGFTIFNSLTLEKDIPIGGQDEDSNLITGDVIRVSLSKEDLNARVEYLEKALNKLLNS